MVTYVRSCSLRIIAASLALAVLPALAEDPEGVVRLDRNSEGLVRISDETTVRVERGQSPDVMQAGLFHGHLHHGHPEHVILDGEYCPPDAGFGHHHPLWPHHPVFCHGPLADWFHAQALAFRTRNMIQSAMLADSMHAECHDKHAWLRCKFGYFVPTGCNGAGCPPIGHYHMVYPVNPGYFDQRDGQVYAAATYGGPVSIPLAPVVNHTYNYGWGIPSSRLTPVLHPPAPGPLPIAPAHIHPHPHP